MRRRELWSCEQGKIITHLKLVADIIIYKPVQFSMLKSLLTLNYPTYSNGVIEMWYWVLGPDHFELVALYRTVPVKK